MIKTRKPIGSISPLNIGQLSKIATALFCAMLTSYSHAADTDYSRLSKTEINETISNAEHSLESLEESRLELQTRIIRMQNHGQRAKATLKSKQSQYKLAQTPTSKAQLTLAELDYALQARKIRQQKREFAKLNTEKRRVESAIIELKQAQSSSFSAETNRQSSTPSTTKRTAITTPSKGSMASQNKRSTTQSQANVQRRYTNSTTRKQRIGDSFTLLYSSADIRDERQRFKAVSGNRPSQEQQSLSIRFLDGKRLLSSQNLRLQGRGNAQFTGEIMFSGSTLELQSGTQTWQVPVQPQNRGRPFVLNMDARDPRLKMLIAYPKG